MIEYPNILLVGKAGSGKDTVAQVLRDSFPQLNYSRFAFADPVKKIAAELWPDAGRAQQQAVGETMRIVDKDVWLNHLLRRVAEQRTARGIRFRVVVTDGRYRNEYVTLTGEGYAAVRVNCPRAVRIDRLRRNGKLGLLDELEHESETDLDAVRCDYVIDNGEWMTTGGLTKQLAAILDCEAK